MIATNRSCLLARTLLRFASFIGNRLSESHRYFLNFVFALFLEHRKSFLFPALLVSIDHSHSISRRRPRKPLQKFNMCDFVASSQNFFAKAVIACDHWCPYIVRHRAPLRVLLTRVWKPGLKGGLVTTKCVRRKKRVRETSEVTCAMSLPRCFK